MSLHDSDALGIETSSAAESLPDPTTVNGRTHLLTNTGVVDAVWSSTGATPFVQSGVNVASIVVRAGQSKQVQSNGVRWVVAPSVGGRRVFAATAVTDGGGLATFTFTPPFDAVPVVQGHVGPTASTDLTEVILQSVTTAGCVFRVRRAPAVTILGISVITFPINAVGFTVQGIATEPGQGV